MASLVPELYCVDIQRSKNFYINELGFSLYVERPEDKFIYIERQGSRIMIEQVDTGRKWITGELSYPFGRGMSFQIETNNADEMYNSLTTKGHHFFLPIEEKWYRHGDKESGSRQFIIQDPDGFLLRFSQDLGLRPLLKV